MRVFKPTYTVNDGEPREASRYHVSFRDHQRVQRRVVAYTEDRRPASVHGVEEGSWRTSYERIQCDRDDSR